jgi:hypothetical protein
MKEMLAEWQTWLINEGSEDIKKHNFQFLKDFSKGSEATGGKYLEFLRHALENDLINALVKNKIVEYLGHGAFGIVFKLDNDHALKVYEGTINSEFDDSIDDAEFTDLSSSQDVMVYERGGEEYDEEIFQWREIQLVIPLRTIVMKAVPKSELGKVAWAYIDSIKDPIIKFAFDSGDSRKPGYAKALDMLCSNSLTMERYRKIVEIFKLYKGAGNDFQADIEVLKGILGTEIILSAIRALSILVRKGVPLRDPHLGNLGVMPVNNKVIVFDN